MPWPGRGIDRFAGLSPTVQGNGSLAPEVARAQGEKDLMKTTVRYLLPLAVVLGFSLAQCGGSEEAAAPAAGSGGSAGFVASGGSSGSSGGGMGGVTGGAAGNAGSAAGASGAAGGGGPTATDGGASCPGSVPGDGDRCNQGGEMCSYSSEICTCRNSTQTWRCIPLATDAGLPIVDSGSPRFDSGLPRWDGGFTYGDGGLTFGDGGNPAACPDREPESGSSCNTSGGSVLACDYAGTACVCYRLNGQSSWFCY
jgi:hypothetical protein